MQLNAGDSEVLEEGRVTTWKEPGPWMSRIGRKGVPGRKNSMSKGPEVGKEGRPGRLEEHGGWEEVGLKREVIEWQKHGEHGKESGCLPRAC